MSAPLFRLGQSVKIVKLMDTMTTADLVGHKGTVVEVEPLANGQNNYDLRCECGSWHYMHEPELEAVVYDV